MPGQYKWTAILDSKLQGIIGTLIMQRNLELWLQDCAIYLFDHSAAVTIDDCVSCQIFVGPVKGRYVSVTYLMHFHKSTESALGGGGKSSCTFKKCYCSLCQPINICIVCFGQGEGVCKKSTLCMLVKMLKIMDGVKLVCYWSKALVQLFCYISASS